LLKFGELRVILKKLAGGQMELNTIAPTIKITIVAIVKLDFPRYAELEIAILLRHGRRSTQDGSHKNLAKVVDIQVLEDGAAATQCAQ
jgi:hypothetical protein